MKEISLELLTEQNLPAVRAIHREDISEAWVDTADTIMELTQYGIDHQCIGHTYAVKFQNTYIGVILLGEAIPWDTDPTEMDGVPFYRLMGFVLDKRYRGRGIGGYVLETVIKNIYREFGIRPIALGVHADNHAAARFYEKHGFRKTNVMEGNDRYYLRYPPKTFLETSRLVIRGIQPSDFEAYFRRYLMDPDMDRLMGRDASPNEAAAQQSFQWFLHKEPRAYALVRKGTGDVIGNLTVYDSPPASVAGRPELAGKQGRSFSFALSRPWRRKGLMYEAVSAVIEHLFRIEGADYIHCGYLSFNTPSYLPQKKLGFHFLMEDRFVMDGVKYISIENILWRDPNDQ